MKRILVFVLVLLFTLSACQTGQVPAPSHEPGSQGASKLISEKPPDLRIRDSDGKTVEATRGTYSWMYDRGDGTWMGMEADSMHPLQMQKYLDPMTTTSDAVTLLFDVPPQEFTVRCWPESCWDDMEAPGEAVKTEGWNIKLKDGGYIYEVTARWTGENLAAEGTVHYAFYVFRSQQAEPAVGGYCGNTQTTILLNGEEYVFWGDDSEYLTDLLLNLPYDPDRICDCMAEFTVKTEFCGPYGVNLSEGYARCEAGQSDLTEEQVGKIKAIMNNQT